MLEPTMIECRDVRKTYASSAGGVEALHAVNATFLAGKLSALVGPSGCGKSTLLRLLAALDGPDSGAICARDTDVAALSPGALRAYRRDVVTYVAQRAVANLVPHLRLRDHFENRADLQLLEPLGLSSHARSRPDQLSGGEQARAALAVAVARRTPVMLLDEPTAELDRATARHVVEELAAAAARGVTVIVATHDPDVVEQADVVVDMTDPQPVTDHVAPSSPGARVGKPLVVRSVTKRYGETHAVENVSFELPAGEIGVLLGRSGSGKSTLLMILGGWLPADSGDTGVGSTSWAEVGYLPQRFGLLPELSVAENVGLPMRIAGDVDDERVQALLDALGLAHLATRLPAETSIGQQQRVALARALVQRPALLLADEPTSHQDRRSADRVWAAIAAAREDGTACLVATHDGAAAAHADRVWEIADGRLASGVG
ncbi:MAG TPA: ATP-binding cassette domain-containing protein [Gaiellaceae bacterium]|nr:ATP-binding cassette domain-containing protein [Gaiellaceae bacterium]